MYTTPAEVIRFTGVKYTDFRGLKDENDLCDLISTWITQADSLIDSYCNQSFNSDFKYFDAVSNISLRLVANIIALAQSRKDTPVIKHNDWSIQAWLSSDVFTDDLKNDLKPFKLDHSTSSDRIDIVAITGKPIEFTKW